MGAFSANPKAEVSAGFEAVRPGTYRMRVKQVTDRSSKGKTDFEVLLEHITPKEELIGVEGEPLKGLPQNVFSYLPHDAERQGQLKAFVLATGHPWQGYDEAEMVGWEADVIVKVEVYNGENRNKVARFVVPK